MGYVTRWEFTKVGRFGIEDLPTGISTGVYGKDTSTKMSVFLLYYLLVKHFFP